MTKKPTHEITRLLAEAHQGRESALGEVMDLVYHDLKRIAQNRMRNRYGAGANRLTMEPTALVNEAFLRLIKQRKQFDSRGQFFAIASRAMLRVLMDYDRTRRSSKRGGDAVRVSLGGIGADGGQNDGATIADFVEAVEQLSKMDARTGDVVKLRILWGLTVPEISQALDMATRTVEREWRFGRRWLVAQLNQEAPPP